MIVAHRMRPMFSVLAKYRLTREEGLKERWDFLRRRPTTTKIFHLLMQHGEMYQAQIARAIERTDYRIHHAVGPLLKCEIIETERRDNRIYFRLRPSAVTQYNQLRDSHQLDEPEQ